MFPANRFPLEPALWFSTAASAPETPALEESISTDIVIIGAGYAGLSTALHLAELGYRPTVIDARELGFGGSGRNGGQVVPGLKREPGDILRDLGTERGKKLVEFAGQTPKSVFDLIDKYDMDVPNVRNGWLQPAHNHTGLKLASQRCSQWADQGADVNMLSREKLQDLLGTDIYVGGWIDRRGGAVQPLSYVRALATEAQKLGARIHTNTPVEHISKSTSGWVVTTTNGLSIKAQSVIVCANAYADGLWPNLKESIIDINTYQTATETLPDEILRSILPHEQVVADTRNLLLYFRKDDTGRFIMGGRGPFREPKSENDWQHLKHVAIRMYPQLANVKWEYHWCGRVALTRDFYPHLHEPGPGLIMDIGCQGRGIGLQTSMGRAIANYIHTQDPASLPLATTKIRPIPFHNLKRLYVGAAVSWYRLRDGRQ